LTCYCFSSEQHSLSKVLSRSVDRVSRLARAIDDHLPATNCLVLVPSRDASAPTRCNASETTSDSLVWPGLWRTTRSKCPAQQHMRLRLHRFGCPPDQDLVASLLALAVIADLKERLCLGQLSHHVETFELFCHFRGGWSCVGFGLRSHVGGSFGASVEVAWKC